MNAPAGHTFIDAIFGRLQNGLRAASAEKDLPKRKAALARVESEFRVLTKPPTSGESFLAAVTPELSFYRDTIRRELEAIAACADEDLAKIKAGELKRRVEKWKEAAKVSTTGADELQDLLASAWASGTAKVTP